MPFASTELTTDAPTDKDEFIRQLPQRMAAIEENWSELSHWSAELLDKLYRRIREISEASSRFGLFQLNESVFSVEVYLSSFVGIQEAPVREQLEAIEGLLNHLKSTANSIEQVAVKTTKADQTIYILSDESGDISKLANTLQEHGTEIHFFDETGTLLRAMDSQLPNALIANTNLLLKISALTAELVRLKSQTSQEIPLIFISESNALQLRVDAIRCGSDAYFVSPIDTDDVAQQILNLASPRNTPAFRVLIVEDDPTQAEFASSLLRKVGMKTQILSDPMRIIEILREFIPDLILMDIYMPEINGIEMTSIIREYHEFVGIPIVFLSGEQNADKQLDAISVGGDDFVAKPIRPKHLLTIVENRIKRSHQLMKTLGSRLPHDRITGLLSRQVFFDRIAKALEDDPMHAQPSGVIVLSPDKMESHRKTFGIGGVDQLIAELSQNIRSQLKDNDAAARLDDDSIGLFIKRSNNNSIHDLCARLHETVTKSAIKIAGQTIELSIGLGLCLYDENIDDPAGLIARAQTASQQALIKGSGQTHIHSSSNETDRTKSKKEDDITKEIRHCLNNDGFVVHYQPMLDLQTRNSENYEVILQMPMANGDLIGERQLREPAKQAKLLSDMDRWLMEHAISMLKNRRTSGKNTHIFVRQSAASVTDSNLPAWLLGRLRLHQMVGTGLVLDFRLSDLSADLKTVQKNIAALRDMDVEVSLSRFPNKPPAYKVLRFVKAQYIAIAPQLLKADRDAVTKVIQQSHKVGAKVIVCNIDDPRSIDLHWSSGADYLQGNFIQRPLDNMDYDFAQVVI